MVSGSCLKGCRGDVTMEWGDGLPFWSFRKEKTVSNVHEPLARSEGASTHRVHRKAREGVTNAMSMPSLSVRRRDDAGKPRCSWRKPKTRKPR